MISITCRWLDFGKAPALCDRRLGRQTTLSCQSSQRRADEATSATQFESREHTENRKMKTNQVMDHNHNHDPDYNLALYAAVMAVFNGHNAAILWTASGNSMHFRNAALFRRLNQSL